MLRTRTIILFLVKTIIIYLLFSASFSFYDEFYGKLFRKSSEGIFHRFHHNGFVKLVVKDKSFLSTFYVGNYSQIAPDGKVHCAIYELNTRHFGYLPTILLISLILGSPVKWKRMVTALTIGLVLICGFIIFKEWLYIQQICVEQPWLKLYDFSEGHKKFLEHFVVSYVSPTAPTLVLTIFIWILVTFNIRDLTQKPAKPSTKGSVRKSP